MNFFQFSVLTGIARQWNDKHFGKITVILHFSFRVSLQTNRLSDFTQSLLKKPERIRCSLSLCCQILRMLISMRCPLVSCWTGDILIDSDSKSRLLIANRAHCFFSQMYFLSLNRRNQTRALIKGRKLNRRPRSIKKSKNALISSVRSTKNEGSCEFSLLYYYLFAVNWKDVSEWQ